MAPKRKAFESQGEQRQRITLLYRGGAPWSPETFHDKMVYGLDKMVYALPWLYETAIKRSWGDKMVYALPSLDKTAIGLGKAVYGLPWLDKTAIGLHKTVIGGHFGLLDKTSIGLAKTATGAPVDEIGICILSSSKPEP